MAEGIIYPKGVVPRNEDFREAQKMRGEVYNFLKSTMEETAESAFNSMGYDQKAVPAGFYGDGNAYGYGVDEGKYNVKVGSKTDSYLEKRISLGGKRIVVEMHMTIYPESMTVEMHYKNTEDAAFRGFKEGKGGYMINEKIIMNCANMENFKKEITKKLKEFSEKEIGFITMTKLGNDDRMEKSTASVVEGFTLKSLFTDDFKTAADKIEESVSLNISETRPRPNIKQEPAQTPRDGEFDMRRKPMPKVRPEAPAFPRESDDEESSEKDDLLLGDKMNEGDGTPYSPEQVKDTLNSPYAQSTFFITNYGNVLSPDEALDWDHEDSNEWIVKGDAHWEGGPMHSESGELIPSVYGEDEVSEITTAGAGPGGAGAFGYDVPIRAKRKRGIKTSAPFDQPVNEAQEAYENTAYARRAKENRRPTNHTRIIP
ncbi:MAG: hypothetical protein P8J32_06750, partial [bacterium]|nr:hypothetical protein [bacterium]